jgi:hypothetical protein
MVFVVIHHAVLFCEPQHRAWLDQFYKFSENEQQDVLVGLLLRSSENQLRVADHHIR